MNKTSRNEIDVIISKLDELSLYLDSIREVEQANFDNLPESIQYSECGERISDNVDDLENAVCSLDDLISSLQDIIER